MQNHHDGGWVGSGALQRGLSSDVDDGQREPSKPPATQQAPAHRYRRSRAVSMAFLWRHEPFTWGCSRPVDSLRSKSAATPLAALLRPVRQTCAFDRLPCGSDGTGGTCVKNLHVLCTVEKLRTARMVSKPALSCTWWRDAGYPPSACHRHISMQRGSAHITHCEKTLRNATAAQRNQERLPKRTGYHQNLRTPESKLHRRNIVVTGKSIS